MVKFDLAILTRELDLIRELARDFLEAESAHQLEVARWQLHSLPRDDASASWQIGTPLKTRPSLGDYAQDGNGEYTVQANITTLWDVTRTGQHDVVVRDNVSTSVSITNNEGEIAHWTMDLAAVAGAPGCGLHAQVKHHRAIGFDVPRVPLFIPTLGAVLEFVLGELFQQTWTKHVASHKLASSWLELQRRAWRRWLCWQQEIIRTSSISPWLDVKVVGCAGLNDHP